MQYTTAMFGNGIVPFLLLAFAVCSLAHSAEEVLGEVSCNPKTSSTYRLVRGKCAADDSCVLSVQLREAGKTLSQKKAGGRLKVPGGKITRSGDFKWTIAPKKPPANGSPGTGADLLEVQLGQMKDRPSGLLISSTRLGGALSFSSYEYFFCDSGNVSSVWAGHDEGSDSQATVTLKDINGDGFDEILVLGGSFSAGGRSGLRRAIFHWDPARKTMIPNASRKN